MDAPLRQALAAHASLSIVGMGKNAGKTTVLNTLIGLLAGDPRTLALTSIGRDGEATDIVTGTEKPGIWVRADTLVATATDMLRLGDITPEILGTTGMHTPVGEVVIVRALSDGFVQLAGPSMGDQLARLSGILRDAGAELVLMDGAIGRKSLAAPVVSDAAILCAGASYHPDMEAVVADTAYACTLMTLPVSEGAHARRHLIDGALTDAVLRGLAPAPGDEITVRDSSRILITRDLFVRQVARGVRFTVLAATTLCCICVNPYSATGVDFDKDRFLSRMRDAVPVPVLNVKELP